MGLFGISNHSEAAKLSYFALYAQQHRGQEGAGIASWNGKSMADIYSAGLACDIFTEKNLSEDLSGYAAIAHLRYFPNKIKTVQNGEPFVVRRQDLSLAIAHDGILTNRDELRTDLEKDGAIFQGSTDSEVFAHLIIKNLSKYNLEDSIRHACKKAKGSYCLVILANDTLIAVRDPYGYKPLSLGKLGNSFLIASETCALDLLEATTIRPVEANEILVIDNNGQTHSSNILEFPVEQKQCIFEVIYFARPDSYIFGHNVYLSRKRMGEALAAESSIDADLIMPFPDSGIYSAVGYSKSSNIPYEHALVRNHYVGRTFIQPTQEMRNFSIKVKLNPVREVIENKRIIIVDDSIVRGSTMRVRVKKLRELGAKEIHCRISCPPVVSPCRYGVDFTSKGELIAAKYSKDEICSLLGLDSLHYLSIKGLLSSVPEARYCLDCFKKNDQNYNS